MTCNNRCIQLSNLVLGCDARLCMGTYWSAAAPREHHHACSGGTPIERSRKQEYSRKQERLLWLMHWHTGLQQDHQGTRVAQSRPLATTIKGHVNDSTGVQQAAAKKLKAPTISNAPTRPFSTRVFTTLTTRVSFRCWSSSESEGLGPSLSP